MTHSQLPTDRPRRAKLRPIAGLSLLALLGACAGGNDPFPLSPIGPGLSNAEQLSVLRHVAQDLQELPTTALAYQNALDSTSKLRTDAQMCPQGGAIGLLRNGSAVSPGSTVPVFDNVTYELLFDDCRADGVTKTGRAKHTLTNVTQTHADIVTNYTDLKMTSSGTKYTGDVEIRGDRTTSGDNVNIDATLWPHEEFNTDYSGRNFNYYDGSLHYKSTVGPGQTQASYQLDDLMFKWKDHRYKVYGDLASQIVGNARSGSGEIKVRAELYEKVGSIRFDGAGKLVLVSDNGSTEDF